MGSDSLNRQYAERVTALSPTFYWPLDRSGGGTTTATTFKPVLDMGASAKHQWHYGAIDGLFSNGMPSIAVIRPDSSFTGATPASASIDESSITSVTMGGNQVSVGVWVSVAAQPVNFGAMVDFFHTQSFGGWWQISSVQSGANSGIRFGWNHDADNVFYSVTSGYWLWPVGVPFYLGAVWSTADLKVYVNGQLVSTVAHAHSAKPPKFKTGFNRNLRIGNRAVSSYSWGTSYNPLLLSHLAIWDNRVLTAGEFKFLARYN